jgi:superfamily II DNA or RNA helicase
MDEQDILTIKQIYEEMAKELKNLEKTEKKDGDNKLTILLRAREKTELIKIPLIVDLVNEGIEQGMSVVVFLNFTNSIKALSERLNTKCIFDGKTPDKIRQQNVDEFQSDKERIIIVNTQSGGAGLTLGDITGKYPRLSLISPSYSAVIMRQCTGRVWRENSKTKSVQKIVFVADTVEESVCESVKQKLNNLDTLNDGDLIEKINYI